MIIAIASGKGGTGKTTIATNLALSLSDAQFIDCDVEEPNANIFLKVPIETVENVTLEYPKINKHKCTHCGKCSDFCAYNALAILQSKALVFPELCHACGGCELVCPENAVTWKRRKIGIVESGKKDTIEFSHGLLNIGEMQAIPTVSYTHLTLPTN